MIEPCRERRVEIDNVAGRIDRKESCRRMVQVVNGVLEFLENVFLTLAVARHVGDRPHGHARIASALAKWTHPHAQPTAALCRRAGNPHFFLQTTAFARGFEQSVDRLRNVGVADEYSFDRLRFIDAGSAGQIEISSVGIEDTARLVADQDAVDRAVDHGFQQRIALVLAGKPQDTGGDGK